VRTTNRNKRLCYFCLYDGKRPLLDENGKDTGEKILLYKPQKKLWANISPATGVSGTEQFGNLESYDKVIVTNDISCPIDENSVLFIDKAPEYTRVLTWENTESDTLLGDDTLTPVYVDVPVPDYIVRRVAKSLNSVSIAVRKVTLK